MLCRDVLRYATLCYAMLCYAMLGAADCIALDRAAARAAATAAHAAMQSGPIGPTTSRAMAEAYFRSVDKA
jgi:hypothetical protein